MSEVVRWLLVLEVAVMLACGLAWHRAYRDHVPRPLWRVGWGYGWAPWRCNEPNCGTDLTPLHLTASSAADVADSFMPRRRHDSDVPRQARLRMSGRVAARL